MSSSILCLDENPGACSMSMSKLEFLLFLIWKLLHVDSELSAEYLCVCICVSEWDRDLQRRVLRVEYILVYILCICTYVYILSDLQYNVVSKYGDWEY